MRILGTALAVCCLTFALTACDQIPDIEFKHGVASGDPLQDAVIIWTRVTPTDTGEETPVPVHWTVGRDAALSDIVSEGEEQATVARDYTVKVDVGGLSPGEHYYYGFSVGSKASSVGRTKTLPANGISRAKLAVVSCSNYPAGYFNVYRDVAGRDDIDVVVHLGDYIYEYGADGYGGEQGKKLGRIVEPVHEILSLADYRTRYAQYRRDPDLQALTSKHPVISVWDDHETANNSYKDGAENHNEGEGDWDARKAAAVRAYYEWLPIRMADEQAPAKTYRSFQLGGLASLIMLDTRIAGRMRQIDYATELPNVTTPFDFSDPDNPKPITDDEADALAGSGSTRMVVTPYDVSGDEPKAILDYGRIQELSESDLPDGIAYLPDADKFREEVLDVTDRTILGAQQEAWLRDELKASKAAGIPWQILGQQLLIGELLGPDLSNTEQLPGEDTPFRRTVMARMKMANAYDLPVNLDAWDGYPAARNRLADDIFEHANNVVVISGDTHNGWAFNLDVVEGAEPYAVEFGTPGVSSPGLETIVPVEPEALAQALVEKNHELVYANVKDRGYLVLDVTREAVTSSWYFVDTIDSQDYSAHCEQALRVRASDGPGTSPLEDALCE